ncbi:TcpQ domain-containing protein [Aliiglaciecola sp. 3_MG-2023]|uniref:TcpQ domain-containing protein n=1 Tax=Aliiglaciecola sp. 3_MG-2023 TaxID=3062644 RepID=UPI0026E39D5D|nr:TcpQ domain-containing protein [Aliiglaciecola sp. 3_MG-2023]MDO6691897.1 TcpQ domain-containing protein [Aliiglaciecola sp. 3_MG-2023]
MSKKTSNFLFWARHIGLAIALIIIAAIVLNLQRFNMSSPKPEGKSEQKSVSQGMTDFYAAYRMSSSKPFEDDIGDFVLPVNPPKEPLEQRLRKMVSIQSNINSRWVGEHKYRSFRAGSTLREAITNYAQSEGMQVLWELDKDFIIKSQFQLDDTITGSMAEIASAVNGSFEKEVKAYICPKQRSMIVTQETNDYVLKNCYLLE